MPLLLEPYATQVSRWPAGGRHILAQFDAETIVVYQAYRPETGHYAAKHGRFGDGFSLDRMSWIKPNFLWMMFRSGWGTKEGQEVVLAIRLQRAGFDEILRQAVPSSFEPTLYDSHDRWEEAVATSSVRLQWDPDHDPSGAKQERRAIQLGLSGATLRKYVEEWTVSIDDISALVAEQRQHSPASRRSALRIPREEPYPVRDPDLVRRLRLSTLSS